MGGAPCSRASDMQVLSEEVLIPGVCNPIRQSHRTKADLTTPEEGTSGIVTLDYAAVMSSF